MINRFEANYAFLSNFFMFPVHYEGLWFPSSEHAYQAAKTIILAERIMIRDCGSAAQAKRLGSKKRKKITLRAEWDSIRVDKMTDILRSKFENPRLMEMLINTNPEQLIEGNYWHDNFWGDCACEKCEDIQGRNNLGEVLMKVRSELLERN